MLPATKESFSYRKISPVYKPCHARNPYKITSIVCYHKMITEIQVESTSLLFRACNEGEINLENVMEMYLWKSHCCSQYSRINSLQFETLFLKSNNEEQKQICIHTVRKVAFEINIVETSSFQQLEQNVSWKLTELIFSVNSSDFNLYIIRDYISSKLCQDTFSEYSVHSKLID